MGFSQAGMRTLTSFLILCMATIRVRRTGSLGFFSSALVILWGVSGFGQSTSDQAPELALVDAIQIALGNNRPVQIARLDVTKYGWEVAEAKTHRFPELKTELLASGNIDSPSFTFKQGVFGTIDNQPVPTTDKQISLSSGLTGYAIATVAQPISQLYQIHLLVREKQLSVDLAGEKYKQKRQATVVDVKQGYYAILQSESALESEQALIKEYEETDRVTTQYLSKESILKSDSLQVKAQLAQARHQLITLRDDLQTQKEHFNDLLGRDLDTSFRTQPVPPASTDEMDLKAARKTALQQRPELQEAKINVEKAGYDRSLAKAEYIPGIGAQLQYLTPINTQILPQNILSVGLKMTWEPYEWGRRKDNVKEKDIQVQQSQYQLDHTSSQVLLDVDNTFRKLSESRSMLEVAQAARDAANEKLREVNDQYRQVTVLLRDVLKQQAAVANANHEYEESLLAFWNAKAEFEKALGEE
ncbi:TolC family protein [Tunturiibacter empetritectus]|uniref:Outer membrane protein TolC n=2 Tax=Tunturiibacter TaxID=3154218 RepID=A0A852VM24_9BACT|nr:TolC family protein [Edaphobacter lichenicola]NYF91135.1 outer membrane protein TolC [Edaphobacter lichenicola]